MALEQKPAQNQGEKILRLFRRKSGGTKLSVKGLESKLHIAEYLEDFFTGIVIAGVLFEVFIAYRHPYSESPQGRWGPVIADVVVALGLLAEFLCGIWSKNVQGTLTRLSNEKLEAAIRETERLRAFAAWRALTEKQHKGLVLALRASGLPESVMLCVLLNDAESYSFAKRLEIVFRAAKWEVGFRFDTYVHDIVTGIRIPELHGEWPEGIVEVTQRVREAFIAAEIPFVNGGPAHLEKGEEKPGYITEPYTWVYVGPKPPPPYEWSFEEAKAG